MSETQHKADEADGDEQDRDITNERFYERLAMDGVTLDGSFYMPEGTGRQRRYFEYDPAEVKGFDAVRDDDGEIVAQKVASHDTAMIENVGKDHIEEVVKPKVREGFGSFGFVRTEVGADEESGSAGSADSGGDGDFEPMDDDETFDTIRENHGEHGFFSEDDDDEPKVVSLAHPDARLMGYITGSHVGALPADGLSTVDDYRDAVYQALERTGEPEGVLESPDDVPIMTDDMMETFTEAGNQIKHDEETRERLSNQVEARWEDGEYDHLRDEDDEQDEQYEQDEEGAGGEE